MPITFPPNAQGNIFNKLTKKKLTKPTIAHMRFPEVNPIGTVFTDRRIYDRVLGFPTFDGSLMPAIIQQWPISPIFLPTIIASGMTPPERMPV